MDAYLAIVSLRVVRDYSDKPISDESLERILQAGRATGSSQNRQQWKFYIVHSGAIRDRLAPHVYAPANIRNCQVALAVASTSKSTFDGARAFQNMALAAWNDGIGYCPNSVKDADEVRQILGLSEGESVVNIMSLGYPQRPYHPDPSDVAGILRRIDRKPLEELAVRVD